jgi:hypothetical protein
VIAELHLSCPRRYRYSRHIPNATAGAAPYCAMNRAYGIVVARARRAIGSLPASVAPLDFCVTRARRSETTSVGTRTTSWRTLFISRRCSPERTATSTEPKSTGRQSGYLGDLTKYCDIVSRILTTHRENSVVYGHVHRGDRGRAAADLLAA